MASFLRKSQRPLTAVLPHANNRRYAIPNPRGISQFDDILLLGDSILVGDGFGTATGESPFDNGVYSRSTAVAAVNGGSFLDIAPDIANILAANSQPSIYINCGSNDFFVNFASVADTKTRFETTIEACIDDGREVVMGNILPRQEFGGTTGAFAKLIESHE